MFVTARRRACAGQRGMGNAHPEAFAETCSACALTCPEYQHLQLAAAQGEREGSYQRAGRISVLCIIVLRQPSVCSCQTRT